ncbi:hypothetical protein ACHAXS_006355 [Conticribra weissflogii]
MAVNMIRSRFRPSEAIIVIVVIALILGVQGANSSKRLSNLKGIKSYATNNSSKTRYRIHDKINVVTNRPIPSSSTASSAVAAVSLLRGGAIDDGSRRRNFENQRQEDRYQRYNDARDRRPPQRPPPSQYDRDRRRPGPSRPGGERPTGEPDRGHDRYRDVELFDNGADRRSRLHGKYREEGDDRERRRERGYDEGVVNGKSRDSWFSRTKEAPATEQKSWDMNAAVPPPPPPPPPPLHNSGNTAIEINPAETERTPIHYMFPTAEAAAEERLKEDRTIEVSEMDGNRMDGEGVYFDAPFFEAEEETLLDEDKGSRGRRRRNEENDDGYGRRRGESGYASPRRDAVTLYMSTKSGAIKVRVGSMIVGAGLGAFVGKVIIHILF